MKNKIKNMITRIAATITALTLFAGVLSSVPALSARAAGKTTYQVDREELAYWQQYCSDYYYRQIKDENARVLYDEFFTLAMYCLISDDDIEGYDVDMTGYLNWDGPEPIRQHSLLSLTDIKIKDREKYSDWNVYELLLMDNPIFFFLDGMYLCNIDGEDENLFAFLKVDEIYRDGKKRAAAREKIRNGLDTLYNEARTRFSTLNDWVLYVDQKGVDENGEIIRVPYDFSMREDGSATHQDIDSVYVYNASVCAGYAKSNQALFNRFGLDAVYAIRPDHAFVYIETNPGEWYSTEFDEQYLLETPRSEYLRDNIICRGNFFDENMPPMTQTRDYGAVTYLDRQIFTYDEAKALANKEASANKVNENTKKASTNKVPKKAKKASKKSTPVNATLSGDLTTVFRLYNPANGEHIYTTNDGEAKAYVAFGWKKEKSPGKSNADISNKANGVYQLYCTVTGEHLYTTDKNECKTLIGTGVWTYDAGKGPRFYSVPNGSKPMYRLYNPAAPVISSHHYTSDKNEIKTLLSNGWSMDNGGKPMFSLQG